MTATSTLRAVHPSQRSSLWAAGRLAHAVALFLALMLLAFTAPAVRGAVLALQSSTGQARLWEDKLPAPSVPAPEAASPGARRLPVVLPTGHRALLPLARHGCPLAVEGRRPDLRGPPAGARAPPFA